MEAVLTEITSLLTGGITGMSTGIGSGLANLVKNIFLEVSASGEVEGLSIFGGVVVVFAGVSLAIGLSTLVVHWVTSLGSSKGM